MFAKRIIAGWAAFPAKWLIAAACVVAVLGTVAVFHLSRRPESVRAQVTPVPSAPAPPDFEVQPVSSREGEAKWYAVPVNSLPRRRAWLGEMTAASDQLPQNAYVRVTRLDAHGSPGRAVVLRITDNGVHDKKTLIDLDREAAEALGMVEVGQARVRVEVLTLKNATSDKPVAKKDASPVAPGASELTHQPAASEKQEKDSADAKP